MRTVDKSSSTNMNYYLETIAQFNPEWAVTLCMFVEQYPEFRPYLHLAPPSSHVRMPYRYVNSLFKAVVHYICAVGVRYTYAVSQWELIHPLINHDDWCVIMQRVEEMRHNERIQPKKREIYYGLCQFMNEQQLTHETLNVSHLRLLEQNVSGIGVGCVANCKKYFTCDDDCVEYTDIVFKKGFQRLYNTDLLSLRKKKAKEWQDNHFGRVANLFVLRLAE